MKVPRVAGKFTARNRSSRRRERPVLLWILVGGMPFSIFAWIGLIGAARDLLDWFGVT